MMENEWLVYWHWWAIGVVFLIFEMLAPASFFLWMAVSAGIVGGVLLLFPALSFNYQLLLFAAISFIAIGVFRLYRKRHPHSHSDDASLNQRGKQYVGRIFVLEEPIIGGVGKLFVDDTIWRIEGDDLPKGTFVKVVGSRGNALLVSRVDPSSN